MATTSNTSTVMNLRYTIGLPASLILNVKFSNLMREVIDHITGVSVVLLFNDRDGVMYLDFKDPTNPRVLQVVRCAEALVDALR